MRYTVGISSLPLDPILPLEVTEKMSEVNVEELPCPLEHNVVIMSVPNPHHKGRHTVPCTKRKVRGGE